ncbi:alkaline phosphatase family protein, partial [bacterium]|nr:alkaline phosphatase family protein [bacterium]
MNKHIGLQQLIRQQSYVSLLLGMAYGILAGVFTAYCYEKLFPDVLILPIYAGLFYGAVALLAGLVLGFIPWIYQVLSGSTVPRHILIALSVATLSTSFLLLVRLDNTALPAQLAFLKNWAFLPNVLFFLSCFVGMFITVVAAFRFFPQRFMRTYKVRSALLFLTGLYLCGIIFFSWLHGDRSVAMAATSPERFEEMIEGIDDRKIFLIGIDGASWQVLQPLVQAGKVPNFARLMREGVYGNLKTRKPTKSPVIWSTIGSGKSEHKHDIRDFVYRQIPTLSNVYWNYFPFMFYVNEIFDFLNFHPIPVSNSIRQTKMFWNIFKDLQVPTGVIGWWPSWPVDDVDDFLVSERFFWDYINETMVDRQDMIHPDSLFDESCEQVTSIGHFDQQEDLLRFITMEDSISRALSTDIHNLKIGPLEKAYQMDTLSTALSYLGWVYLRDQNKMRLGLHLYDKYAPKVFALYLKGIDPVQHAFWRWVEPEKFDDVGQEYHSLFRN